VGVPPLPLTLNSTVIAVPTVDGSGSSSVISMVELVF
jgi:hypothetical protein